MKLHHLGRPPGSYLSFGHLVAGILVPSHKTAMATTDEDLIELQRQMLSKDDGTEERQMAEDCFKKALREIAKAFLLSQNLPRDEFVDYAEDAYFWKFVRQGSNVLDLTRANPREDIRGIIEKLIKRNTTIINLRLEMWDAMPNSTEYKELETTLENKLFEIATQMASHRIFDSYKNRIEAKGIASDALETYRKKFWNDKTRYSPIGTLFGIVRNKVCNAQRKIRTWDNGHETSDDPFTLKEDVSYLPDETQGFDDTIIFLRQCLQESKLRVVPLELEGKDFPDIAETLGTTIDKVKKIEIVEKGILRRCVLRKMSEPRKPSTN